MAYRPTQEDLNQVAELATILGGYAREEVGWRDCAGFQILWDQGLQHYKIKLRGRADAYPCTRILSLSTLRNMITGRGDPSAVIRDMWDQVRMEQRAVGNRVSGTPVVEDPSVPEGQVYGVTSPSQQAALRNLGYTGGDPVGLGGYNYQPLRLTAEERERMEQRRLEREESARVREAQRQRQAQEEQMRREEEAIQREVRRIENEVKQVTIGARRVRVRA
jgi:hypothetical protein